MSAVYQEVAFEDAIEGHLLAHGWRKGDVANYDRTLALDTAELFGFIDDTQAAAWAKLVAIHGGDPASARTAFLARLVKEIARRGTLDVLRRGIVDRSVAIQLASFRPASGLTPELVERYERNRLTVTRQLPYSPKHQKTVDLGLFLNGIPVATAELKNQLTGQNVEHAKKQYRTDRDPGETIFAHRALVHFAVDPELVFITTKLARDETVFLPFNQGNAGAAGNAPNPAGHATSYLWERVWQRDAWLELLASFVHVDDTDVSGQSSREVIFPRYHQWDAVLAILAHARADGAGHNYLIQHSAGSGKSNTIAWTAYRLASLHDTNDEKVFAKVIVVTDRRTLDRQLRDKVRQFERTKGMVSAAEHHSGELAAALEDPGALIVVTTLQKFPFVIDKVKELGDRRYAIIVDEAHSSQTGETAKALKAVLGSGASPASLLDEAEKAEAAAEAAGDPEDQIASLVARGQQPNLSYLAFTATPKQKTLELFGEKREDGRFHPFHLYSMRQAIEEKFIVDVLENYTTYTTYYRVARKIAEDPELDRSRAAAAIARYVSLDEHNVAQKAEIIVEHFRRVTAHKIGGHAKAMVVTRSRLHAVRYKQAIDAYIASQGIKGVRALVAFSGTVSDGITDYTEVEMNGFSEARLPDHFRTDAYQILVVAEKYQTGYDEPLLQTMYVDKKLEHVKAVQTLSRLNRMHPDKDNTFVLDFANRTEDIQEAFHEFYDETIAEPTDPNLLYNAKDTIEGFGVIDDDDVEAVVGILALAPKDAHAQLYAHLDPAVARYKALSGSEQEAFSAELRGFVRLYAFLAQVVPFSDPALERLYLYGRLLALRLPSADRGSLDIGEDVVITHLRTELTGEHDLSLGDKSGTIELPGFTGDATGGHTEPEKARLSEIIDVLNARFGLSLGKNDQLYFEQLKADLVDDGQLATQARANSLDNFRFGFGRTFTDRVVDRRQANEAIFRRIMDDDEFANVVRELLMPDVYEALRAGAPASAT